jgi:hypothetical protein
MDDRILSGRFKNQHEVGYSQALFDPKARRRVENESMGVPLDAHVASRPIYGYLAEKSYKGLEQGDHQQTANYGSAIVRIKEKAMERSTVTFGDSWALQSQKTAIASPLGAVHHLSVPAQWVASEGEGVLDSSVAWANAGLPYIEAQVQDGLTVGDIAEIRYHRKQAPSQEVQDGLRAAGISWSLYG